ncbi:S-adenosyl-L-methionine-dependent methyltransferase [Phanerochaete sordida]|uniref:S-adenosyl-L-methionine-dependent methyltransferase n=1 Tax=Phanerochaete sordida TaxID=48140 RepID=A0A9P3FXZ9_9APHY|nr:S-adenosyl-L-methionine-dependent methyltransferase [Phanerochaete sordida]
MADIQTLSSSQKFDLVRQYLGADSERGWDNAWKVDLTPWDAGQSQPPLRDLLKSGLLQLPATGRALVPGCGKGYDAPLIASSTGLDTLSIDISPTAVQQARDYVAKLDLPSTATVHFEQRDFFSLGESEDEKFHLVYDYTFFVAIPPERRSEWGQVMRRVVRPGGYLVTLVYPIDPPVDTGPPFFVRPEHYINVLGDGWEKTLDKIPEVSLEHHKNRERLVVWRRK